MLENGRIKERGSYSDLTVKEGHVARLMAEFGGIADSDSESDGSSETFQNNSIDAEKERAQEKIKGAVGTGRLEGRLIVKERRTTGSLSRKGTMSWFILYTRWVLIKGLVYWKYLSAGRGIITVPLLMLSIFFMQGSQIMNTYVLVWWKAE